MRKPAITTPPAPTQTTPGVRDRRTIEAKRRRISLSLIALIALMTRICLMRRKKEQR